MFNPYDLIVDNWISLRNRSEVCSPLKDFASRLPMHAQILDVGCGSGVPLDHYFSQQGFYITGIDSSAKMIDYARKSHILNATFWTVDFFNYQTEKKFDGILAWDSLWHIEKHLQEAIYPRISAMLKPGAYFLFTHGHIDDEHVDKMFGIEFYYSALAKDKLLSILVQEQLMPLRVFDNYTEGHSHRDLIVLAQKKEKSVNSITENLY